MTKTIWLEIDPVDTLFFRGSESMEAGENHAVNTMFPPMPSTIIGAIRTAILKQRNISPVDYLDQPDVWLDKYPFLGKPEKPGFDIIGPILVVDNILLFPAPASWYGDFQDTPLKNNTKYTIQAATPLTEPPLGLSGSVSAPFWISNPKGCDMQPLSGMWVTGASFAAMRDGEALLNYQEKASQLSPDAPAILPSSALFGLEQRVGIALTRQRAAKEGHLYSTVHIRMQSGIKLATGITSDHKSCFDSQGILQLGGEQRICRYRTLPNLAVPQKANSRLLYAVSPLCLSTMPEDLQNCPRTSNKLVRVGGWDMQKKFHKPMEAYLPTGTIIAMSETASKTDHFLTI